MLQIVHNGTRTDQLRSLAGLACCFGIPTEYSVAADFDSILNTLAGCHGSTVVALDVGSLSKACTSDKFGDIAAMVHLHAAAVLLLITEASEVSDRFLQELTRGAVRGVEIQNGDTISFPESSRDLSGELSSYSYRKKPGSVLGLIIEDSPIVETVTKIGNAPSFVHVRERMASMFVWSTPQIFDVERPLAAELEFEAAADEYVPAIIFLRYAFREQCWHNPTSGAGIVIDDPLLEKKYGFINFPPLLESARKHHYHITLAFIPWNHWRTRTSSVQLFLKYSDCFSVCLHGCDHTKREFRSTDYEELLEKNFIACQRMERQHRRTGVTAERLMVCPQEEYSIEAMRAFSDSRQFQGLVCTACMPRNLPGPQICGADLLLPAQDSFFGFPVFKRHYWSGMEVFAMALFLGKPAILVEHHDFFRNGSAGAEGFARCLAELRPDLKWKSLAETVMRTHSRRRMCGNTWEVRFFTDSFQLEHGLEEPAEYQLLRRIPEATPVKRVLMGGQPLPFYRKNGFIRFETRMEYPQTVRVQLDISPIRPTRLVSLGLKYQTSVAIRRGLSEFRDNVLARNGVALRIGTRLVKALKQTVH